MKPYYEDAGITIYQGDVLTVLQDLPAEAVHCCVTSPPYWGLRDYGVAGQLGLERTPEEYVARLVEVFCEVRRVLRGDGTLWLNLGDSYATGGGNRERDPKAVTIGPQNQPNRMPIEGLKPKDLVGIPWRVAFALQADGWYLRSDIIWAKLNPMPESVTDRPTKAHEYLFLLSRSERYYYDAEAIKEPSAKVSIARRGRDGLAGNGHGGRNSFRGQGANRDSETGPANRLGRDMRDIGTGETRNRRSVWTIATEPYPEAHFATFPEALIEPCIKAGCPAGGTVLEPFMGSGTTLAVARRFGCDSIGIELNPEYIALAEKRLQQPFIPFKTAATCNYVKAAEIKANTPTLFDLMEAEESPSEKV